jgi:hypothetical protein
MAKARKVCKSSFSACFLDGHITSDRPHLAATEIMAHHNAIWADFLAPRGPAPDLFVRRGAVIHLNVLRAPQSRG